MASSSSSSVSSSSTEQSSGAQVVQKSIYSLIASDLLGGVFTADAITVSDFEEVSAPLEKVTLNVPVATKSYQIDTSRVYLGTDGDGKFVLSMKGSGEERLSQTENTSYRIRDYDFLTLRFIFHQYHFKNSCLGDVYLHGEIHCDVVGEYYPEKEYFSGGADCQNGPKESPNYLLYITESGNHEVGLNIHAEINGHPLSTGSYEFTGNFIIDGETKNVADLMKDYASCSN